MAIAVDTDTVPTAPQPVTSTQDIAESLVSAASDVVAKEGQDAGTSDAQLLTDNDNGATSLSKAEEPDVANVVPDAGKLEDSNTVEIEDNGLKKFDDDHVVAVKDADIANSISTNGMTNTDSQKINNVTCTSTSEETPEAFVTEVSPSTQESTLSMKPTTCDTIETEIASGLTVNSNPSIPTVVEGEAPVMEQQGAQTITDTSSHVNGKITKLDPAEEDDTQVELMTEKVADADLGNAEKEVTSLKSKGVEDKTAGSDVKEEAAMEIKADVSHVESAIPKINIQIEEAPETINVVSPNVDDSPIAVQVVAPTPALVDNRQLEESDTENTDIPEKFHEEATSTDTILFEDVITEGTATPRAKPEVKESTGEKVGVKEEAVENESLEVTPSATDEVYLIKEEMSTAITEAPANAAEETPAVDESVETAAEEVSAVNFTPDAVEEHISVQERDPTQVESVAEEVVAAADFPLVEEKPVIDEAAVVTESKTVSTDNMASVSIPEMQFTQEDLEVPVTVPVQDKSTIDEVVATETESISKAAPLTIAEPQPVQDAPSDSAVIAAFEGQHTEEDVSHTATVDGVQTSQPPTIEESNDTTKIMHELVPFPPGDLTPEPAAEAVVTHEIPAAEEIVITQEEIVETAASQEEVVDATDSKNVLTEPVEESAIVEVVCGVEAEATVDFEAHVEATEEQFAVTGEIPVTWEGRRDGADVRVAEEPVLEKPAKEGPVIEELTKGEPVLDESVNEPSVVEVSVKEEPASEEPVNEPSVVERLVKEEPIVEESMKELPAVEESVKEEPALEELTKEEPPVEESTKEESVLDEPMKEESVLKKPAKEEPVTEELTEEPVLEVSVNKLSIVEESVKEEPALEEFTKEEPAVEEFTKGEPVFEEPVSEPSVAEVSVKEELVLEDPVKEEPVLEKFVTEPLIVEGPVKEEPVLEKPAKEEPVIEELTKGEPVLEEPVNELSVVEVSVKEEPASKDPVNEPSVVEQLVKEEPIVEEPTKELPALEESVKEESALEELTKGEPILDKPVNEPSVVEVSVKEKPALEEPVKEEPVLEESVNKPPVVEEPVKKELIAEQIYPQEEPVPEPAKEEPVTVICIGEPVKEELVSGEVPMIEEPWVDEFAREESVIKVSTTEKAVIKDSMKEEPVTEGVPTKEESVVEELEDEPIAEVLLKSGTAVEVADKDEIIAEELTGKEPTIEELTQEEHAIEAPARESVVEEIPAKEEHAGEKLITKGDHAVGGRASMAKFVVEEVSEKGDFAVEEPVKEEPLAEELAKAQPIAEAVGEEPVQEFAKEQLVAEKVLAMDESAAGIPAKEEPDAEDTPAKEEEPDAEDTPAKEEEPDAEDTPAKEESIVEELPVAEEPVEGELIIETRKEGCELAGLVVEVAPGESAGYEEVVEEFSVSATAAKESIPIMANTPIEHVEHGVIEPIPAKETPAVEILAAQEISVGQATSASPQPVEDVELSSTGELGTKAKESVLDGAVVDVAIPILEEERSAEASDKSTTETAIDQSTTASAPVVQATEESVAPAVSVPLTQDTLNVDKTDSNALFTIPPAELGHGSAVATVDEPRAHEQVVAYDLSDHDAVEFIGDKPVVLPRLISGDPATESVKITSRVDDSAPEDTPTEKSVAANEKSPTVSLTESPSDESVLIAEVSVADTTTETIMVPEFNEEKKEVDMVSVVEEISIADGVGTFMPEKFILKIPDDSIQVERPWTPSFQVTTIGHGISLPAEEVIPTQALDDTENVKPARPEIMVDVSPSDIVIEAAQPPAETDEPGPATLSWSPSYSVHSQGSPSPNHAPLEQATASTEQENTRIISDTYVAQTPSDADKTIVYPSISEATEIKDVELIQDQDVQVIKDSSHEEQEPEAAVVAPQVVERQEVECESLAQEPVQDESEPCYEAPTELHIEPEVTQKPFIAQVSSPMPPLEQDHPVSSSSPLPEQLSLPDTKPAEIVTTETLEESLTMENGISQVGVESIPPTVELNDSQPKDTQEEPVVDNHPSASWTYSCSVTEQGGDILEEAQLGTLVKGDLSIDREPRHSLSEEIEGSSGFSTAALIGAGVFGNAASAAHATLQKSTTSFKSAEELANTSMDSDAISSGSRQENFFPALEIPDENRSHTSSSLRPLDENNTLDLSSSLSPDVYPLSSRKRLESTSSRLLPGGWFSGTSKIPDERTSLEVARGIFTGTKQAPVEETLISPTVGPDSLVCEQSSDKRRCLIM